MRGPPGAGRRRRWGCALVVAAVGVGPVVLAGCAGQEQSGPASARVATWVSGAGGGATIGTLKVDSANVDLALSHHDPAAAIRTVCSLLANDAQAAIGNLPTPDTRLTEDLDAAYRKAAAAGDDCYHGASGGELLQRSARERATLLSLLDTAVDRITSVTGRVPSTSTTTAPIGANSDPFGN